MTPKDKAKDLIKNHLDWIGSTYFVDRHYSVYEGVKAKALSLYLVEQILLNFEGLFNPEYVVFDAIGERKFTYEGEYNTHMTGYDMIGYWTEVKSELENLEL